MSGSVFEGPDKQPYYSAPSGLVYAAGGDNVNCTLSVCPVELSTYGYRASLPLSSILIALYTLCAIVQTYMGWKYRTWSFMISMQLGCLLEILGYVGRILMWQNPWADGGFIMQIVLITLAPVFFSAAMYVLLYVIIRYISLESSRIDPRIFWWVFIPCDIISLVLQAVGGAMSSTSNGTNQAGVDIALAGLGFQVATLTFFAIATVDYMILSRHVWRIVKLPKKFKLFAGFLTAAFVFIMIRCCYRVYELSEGYSEDSEALRDQPLFIALEGVMVIAAAWSLVGAHPGPVFYAESKAIVERDDSISMRPLSSVQKV